jgi:hypothetical protein
MKNEEKESEKIENISRIIRKGKRGGDLIGSA